MAQENIAVLRSALLQAVGECLHNWSSVELEVANLYMIFQGIKRDDLSHPARSAYESVISLDARLTMLAAYSAADETLRLEYNPHLKLLKNCVSKLYKKRHEVAHFVVVSRQMGATTKVLIRPFFTWDKFMNNTGPELDAKQVTERALSYVELAYRIKRHIQHVGALRKLPPEYYVQAGDIAFPPLGPIDLNPAIPPPPP